MQINKAFGYEEEVLCYPDTHGLEMPMQLGVSTARKIFGVHQKPVNVECMGIKKLPGGLEAIGGGFVMTPVPVRRLEGRQGK